MALALHWTIANLGWAFMAQEASLDLAPSVAHGVAFQLNRIYRYPTLLTHLGVPMNKMPETYWTSCIVVATT